MAQSRPKFSICIPAYNRARHLPALLDSIFSQDFGNFNVVICEDQSRERDEISAIVSRYQESHPGFIDYYENGVNLGYDANIRNLVDKAAGEFCFFMGNDDIMCPGSLRHVAELIERHPNVGFVLKSYGVFDERPDLVSHELRYFGTEREFNPGRQAILVCFRRSGVISGYIVRRDDAHECATTAFDGTLYYQMHMTTNVLMTRIAVFTPRILVLCRNSEPPDFGNSFREKGVYTPGRYTPQARLSMVRGALSIATAADERYHLGLHDAVMADYANYFYPFIMDQLSLPLKDYIHLYWAYWKMGFARFPMFHAYCVGCYVLGRRCVDSLSNSIRRWLGRNVQFGSALK